MESLVSVIIPTYGGNVSLKRAIDSVLMQDYDELEIIVVDDNNPGTEQRKVTESIMEEYKEKKNIVYIQHKENRNGAVARNTGAKAAKGMYLSLLDDDDIYLQGKIRKQADYLNLHSEFDAVYCWRKEGDQVVGSNQTGDLSIPLLDLTFTPCTASLMIRRNAYFLIDGFDENYYRHQDFEFLLRFFKKFKIGVVEEPLIEIIGNGIDNQPKGTQAIEIKKKFLSTFSSEIEELNKAHKGFKKGIYAKHYAILTTKLLRYGDFSLALKTYISDGYKGGIQYWLELMHQIFLILKKQFSKINK